VTAEAPAPIREAGSGRLAALDALRGVAALLVVVQHGGEQLWSGFRSFTGGAVQLGQLGVMAFFLVSGFVIPLSLERGRSLRRFVLTRVSRLYPAYWLSLLAVLAAWQAGRFQVPHPFGTDPAAWAVEATMLQAFSGVPNLQGQYWSLAFELIFYSIAAVLFVLRLHRRSVPLAVGALAVAAGAHLVGRLTGTTVPLGLANLATMFVGTVLWRVRSGQCRPATGWALYVAGALAVQLVLVLRLYGRTDAPGARPGPAPTRRSPPATSPATGESPAGWPPPGWSATRSTCCIPS